MLFFCVLVCVLKKVSVSQKRLNNIHVQFVGEKSQTKQWK